MKKFKTLDSFYKRKIDGTTSDANQKGKRAKAPTTEHEQHQNQPFEPDGNVNETLRQNTHEIDPNSLERDPAKRKPMWDYPINQREQVRRSYLSLGPFQVHLTEYPFKGSEKHPRRFQYSWFKVFPNWLEYSPTTNAAYCFICYVFHDKPNVRHGSDAFTVNDHAMELLTLGSSLMFKKSSKVLDIDKICFLVKKYYPTDFTEQERIHLGYQLELFSINVPKNLLLSAASTLAELCSSLVETEKCEEFYLVDRLIRLILTLPVSTATTERAFSAMKLCKNRLRNKMSDDFLASNLVVYIEKEIADTFNSEFLIDEFKKLKGRKAEL